MRTSIGFASQANFEALAQVVRCRYRVYVPLIAVDVPAGFCGAGTGTGTRVLDAIVDDAPDDAVAGA
jgi:hypothetical protein